MMSNTKGDIVNDAYSRLRISGLTVDPTPEDMELALTRLDNMMAALEARDIRLNYRFEDNPDPATEHGVLRAHANMMAANLAVDLSADFGKAASLELVSKARAAMSNTLSITAADNVREVQYPNRQPIGSGNRRGYRYLRFNRPQESAPIYSNVLVKGNVNDFNENFEAYLNAGETIASFEIQADNGLTVISSSNADPIINYRLRADEGDSQVRSFLQVSVRITTSAGRIDSRTIDFQIKERFMPS